MKKLITAISLLALFVSGSVIASAQTTGTSNPNCIVLTTDMTVGATDTITSGQVTVLQNFLQSRGFLNVKPGTAFGTFGSQTQRAVQAFQKNNGIIATGYVGPLTRANIQTISCAIGSQDTSTLPTTVVSSSSVALLTFTSPFAGGLVIKGEKDLGIDWNLAAGVAETFPATSTYLMLDLVGSDGAVVASVGNGVKLSRAGQGNRVENDFKKALKGRRDEVIPSGQYKIKATIDYRPSTSSAADLALDVRAATYASESGWFSIVDPAPVPKINFNVSPEFLTAAGSTTLTWSSATGSICNLFNGVATTSIASSGTQTVNVTQSTTYRIECALTSSWPFPGSSYTTTEKKDRQVQIIAGTVSATIASATVGGSPKALTFTGTTNAPELGFRIFNSAGTLVYTSDAITIRNGQYSKTVSASLFGGADGQYTIKLHGPIALTGSTVLASKTFTVSSTTTTCPSGQTWNGTTCVTTPTCNSEQHLENGMCVDNTTSYTCPNGTVVQVPVNLPATSRPSYCPTGAAPTITTIGPNLTPVGATVTLTGTSFTATGNMVYVNGYSATSNYNYAISATGFSSNGTSITFTLPAYAMPICGTTGQIGCPSPLPFAYGSYTLTVKNSNGVSNAKAFVVPSAYINFVAGSKATCENSVTERFGSLVGTCSIGGGCAAGGVVPSTSSPSANPNHWGACISSAAGLNTTACPTGQTRVNGICQSNTLTCPSDFISDGLGNCVSTVNCATNPTHASCNTLYNCSGLVTHTPCSTLGSYRGYHNGSPTPFISTENLSQGEAYTNCRTNQGNNVIRCTWNGGEIYSYIPVGATRPVITAYANNASMFNGGRVQAVNGSVLSRWSVTGSPTPTCTLNGNVVPNNGEQTFTGLTAATYTFNCTNGVGAPATLAYSIEIPTITSTIPATSTAPTLTIRINGNNVKNNETVTVRNGVAEIVWGGVGAHASSCTLNGSSVTANGAQTVTLTTTASYTYRCANSSGLAASLNFTISVPQIGSKPTINVTANDVRVTNGGSVQAPGGVLNVVWGGVGGEFCYVNGTRLSSTQGAQTFTGVGASSYVYECSNQYGTTTLSFAVTATSGTTNTTLPKPTITLKSDGNRITNGSVVKVANGTAFVEWGGTGADACFLDGSQVGRVQGSQTMTGITEGAHTYMCRNSAGETTISYTVQAKATTIAKPTITITINGTRVTSTRNTFNLPGGTATVKWGTVGADSCTLNGSPFPSQGDQTYSGLSSATYEFACSNSAGTTVVKYSTTVPAVLGASAMNECVDLAFNFHRGYESNVVSKLQSFLIAQGFLTSEVTGFYGDKTVEAVKAYQESKGLPQTGMVYDFTRAAIVADSCN
jgi:peptidoglycan hydrolase-like protein with peptidoglycan-binding domain